MNSNTPDHNKSAPHKKSILAKPVLFVIDSFFPALGGAERQAIVLAKALNKKGVEVEFVSPLLEKELLIEDEVDGFRLTRIAYPRIKYLGAIMLMISFSYFIMRNRKKYAYVHVHITKLLAASLGILKPWHRLPVISKISGHAEFSGGVLDKRRKYNVVYRIMVYYIRKLDYIHAISEYTRKVLLDNGFSDHQIVQIPNAVEAAKYTTSDYSSDPHGILRVGFCGRVEKVKGLDVLVAAYNELEAHVSNNMQVLIAGDGRFIETIKNLVEASELTKNIKFLGRIDDVPAFLKQLDIYVQPSYAEGLSNALLEAMSVGLPVIASNISGNVDLVDDDVSGLLFEPGNSAALAEKLQELASDKARRITMGKKAREKILNHYSTDSVSERLIKLYLHE